MFQQTGLRDIYLSTGASSVCGTLDKPGVCRVCVKRLDQQGRVYISVELVEKQVDIPTKGGFGLQS